MTFEVPQGLTELSLGDSINVNGVCLTVTQRKGSAVTVDISSETLQRTNLGELRGGDEVNLERALRLTDRLGGHIVTGHVDGVGTIVEKKKEGEFILLRVRAPLTAMRYIVPKGSIAIDGTSLTVNECRGDEILMTLIPFTLQRTTLLSRGVGERVNLETDILGKYVERLLGRTDLESKGLDRDFLGEHGFMKE
jgi:riboflavin synthase